MWVIKLLPKSYWSSHLGEGWAPTKITYTTHWLHCLHNSSCSIAPQANQAGSSSAMEFIGHQKAFAFLLGTAMIIKAFISDRHSQIAKWMRVECPKKCKELGKPLIDHFFYLWHIGKSKLLNKNIYLSILIIISNTVQQRGSNMKNIFQHITNYLKTDTHNDDDDENLIICSVSVIHYQQ